MVVHLRGSEEHLQQLENEWEPVATHTSWQLESEQHSSDKECDKVPADNSKDVNSDNEPHNAYTTPCVTSSESGSPAKAVQSSSNHSSSSFLGHL